MDGTDAKPVPKIYGAESKLRQVIVNLAGNAVRHTPPGTAIEFAVGTAGIPVPSPEHAVDKGNKDKGSKGNKDKAGKEKAGKDKPTQLARTKALTNRILKREPLTDQSDHAITPDVNTMGVQVSDNLKGFPAGRVRFEVRDHGDGIDPEDVPRIFERFYRLDASRTRDTGGSGLGLSIVKAIVESHHGKISVQPTPGGGATFRVDLPIPPEEPRKEQQ